MSRPQLADLVEEYSTTTGGDPIVVSGAKPNRQAFSVLGATSAEVDFLVDSGSEWAIYRGTYTDSTKTLTRDTVLDSSAGGAEISFSAGTKTVRLVASADFLARLAGHGIPSPAGDVSEPGVSIGAEGNGAFFIDDTVDGWKALCFSVDTAHHLRLYKTSARRAVSLGWTFASTPPGYLASGHQYDGSVVHLFDTSDSHVILEAASESGILLRQNAGSLPTYKIWNDGSFEISKVSSSTGATERQLIKDNTTRVLIGGTYGIEAANLPYTNFANVQVGIGTALGAALGSTLAFVAVGYQACRDLTGAANYVTAVGYQAMLTSSAISRVTMVGAMAGAGCGASDNLGIGYRAGGGSPSGGGSATGVGNVAVGNDSLLSMTTAARNVGLGFESGSLLVDGDENTLLGYQSGNQLVSGDGCVLIGQRAGEHLGDVSDVLVIGNGPALADCWLLGDSAKTVTLTGDLHVSGGLTVDGIGPRLTPVAIDQTDSPYQAVAGQRVIATITSDTEVDAPTSPTAGDVFAVRLQSTSSSAKVTIDFGAASVDGETTLWIGDTTKKRHDEIVYQYDGAQWIAEERLVKHHDVLSLSADFTTHSAGVFVLLPHDQSSADQVGDLRSGSKAVIKRAGFYRLTARARPTNALSDQAYYETYCYVNGTSTLANRKIAASSAASGANNSVNPCGTVTVWLAAGDEVEQYIQCGEANKGAFRGSYGYTCLEVSEC